MAKKLILNVLAGIVLLTVTNAAFALEGQQENVFYRPNFRHIPFWLRPPEFSLLRGRSLAEAGTVVVQITNNNGSKTDVQLTATTDGRWTGPKGEYYESMPTEEQLKAMYGLACPAPVRNNVIFYLGKIDGIEKVVVLTKDGAEFIGPKGEHYEKIPTEEQLKIVYGK